MSCSDTAKTVFIGFLTEAWPWPIASLKGTMRSANATSLWLSCSALLLGGIGLAGNPALALPEGARVRGGQIELSSPNGNTLLINRTAGEGLLISIDSILVPKNRFSCSSPIAAACSWAVWWEGWVPRRSMVSLRPMAA